MDQRKGSCSMTREKKLWRLVCENRREQSDTPTSERYVLFFLLLAPALFPGPPPLEALLLLKLDNMRHRQRMCSGLEGDLTLFFPMLYWRDWLLATRSLFLSWPPRSPLRSRCRASYVPAPVVTPPQ